MCGGRVSRPWPEARATTPREFRQLLANIRTAAGTPSFGRIGVKTGMSRSTAFALVDLKRRGLPKSETNLLGFLGACGLPQARTEEVMALWRRLREHPAAKEVGALPGEPPVRSERPTLPAWQAFFERSLADGDVACRAVRLLWPLVVAVGVFVAGIVTAMIMVPEVRFLLAVLLASPFPIGTVVWGTQTRSTRKRAGERTCEPPTLSGYDTCSADWGAHPRRGA